MYVIQDLRRNDSIQNLRIALQDTTMSATYLNGFSKKLQYFQTKVQLSTENFEVNRHLSFAF